MCVCLCVFAGDSVPAHLEWEPEQPALLVQPGDGGARAGHHPLQDPGLPEGHPHKQTSAQDQHKLQGGTHTPLIVLLCHFKIVTICPLQAKLLSAVRGFTVIIFHIGKKFLRQMAILV